MRRAGGATRTGGAPGRRARRRGAIRIAFTAQAAGRNVVLAGRPRLLALRLILARRWGLLPGPCLRRRVRRMLGGRGDVTWRRRIGPGRAPLRSTLHRVRAGYVARRRVGSGRGLWGAMLRRLHGCGVRARRGGAAVAARLAGRSGMIGARALRPSAADGIVSILSLLGQGGRARLAASGGAWRGVTLGGASGGRLAVGAQAAGRDWTWSRRCCPRRRAIDEGFAPGLPRRVGHCRRPIEGGLAGHPHARYGTAAQLLDALHAHALVEDPAVDHRDAVDVAGAA